MIPRNDRRYSRARAARLPARPGSAAGLPDRDLLGPRGLRPRLHRATRSWRRRPSGGAGQHPQGHPDPELRAAVTPDFEIGCKRILISNNYYPALAADNVDLVTDRIAKITGDAIVTADGTERPVDVLVVATGFHTTEQPIAEHIGGRDGRTLAERVGARRAWRRTRARPCHGFPNLFQLVGPNTGLGHSPWSSSSRARSPTSSTRSRTMDVQAATPPSSRAATRRTLERRPAAPDGAHRVDHRRLRELVPRRPRPQHHAVAAHHVHLPRAARAASTSTRTTSTAPRDRPARPLTTQPSK